MHLVVGLQNPGSKYEATRHNLGGRVVGMLAARHSASFKKARRFISADVAEIPVSGSKVIAAIPTTFMNESGNAVSPLARYYKTTNDELLVVHDDIDLPFAKLRVQKGGGAGGNNGVKSVAKSIKTQDFWRLKVGVGRPPGRMDPANFVLRPFAASEREEIDLVAQYAVDLIELYVSEGGDAARQRAGEVNALLREGK